VRQSKNASFKPVSSTGKKRVSKGKTQFDSQSRKMQRVIYKICGGPKGKEKLEVSISETPVRASTRSLREERRMLRMHQAAIQQTEKRPKKRSEQKFRKGRGQVIWAEIS